MSQSRANKAAESAGVQLGLIITPMLDMSFQILAFFIMTYHPSALEGHIPGNLAPSEKSAQKSDNLTPQTPDEILQSISPDDLLPELQESITVKVRSILKAQETGSLVEGAPAQVFIRTATETDAQMVYDLVTTLHKDPIKDAMATLDARLKDMLKNGVTNKTHLKIVADGDLRQQYVMAVYDTCKRAGFDKIHFVPPPVLNSRLATK